MLKKGFILSMLVGLFFLGLFSTTFAGRYDTSMLGPDPLSIDSQDEAATKPAFSGHYDTSMLGPDPLSIDSQDEAATKPAFSGHYDTLMLGPDPLSIDSQDEAAMKLCSDNC